MLSGPCWLLVKPEVAFDRRHFSVVRYPRSGGHNGRPKRVAENKIPSAVPSDKKSHTQSIVREFRKANASLRRDWRKIRVMR